MYYVSCVVHPSVMYSTGKQREQGQEELEDSEKMIGLLYCPSLAVCSIVQWSWCPIV